jgi:hypothetical protein
MRIFIRILLFSIVVLSFSCEKNGVFVKCPDCTADEPITANLEINLDNNNGTATIINIYEGNIEDSILYKTLTTSYSQTSTQVTINKKYTVTATYYISDSYYIAIDSATPRVRYDKEQCDDPCFYVYDRIINLRLKYTK